jgi:hypothetical protein
MGTIVVVMLSAITEPNTGVTLELPPELPCVFVPARALPEGCPEVSAAALEALGDDVWFHATTHDGSTSLTAHAMHLTGASRMSAERVDAFVQGAADGTGRATDGRYQPTRRGDHLFAPHSFDGVSGAELELEPDLVLQKKLGKVLHIHGYLVPVNDQLIYVLETGTIVGDMGRKVMMRLKVPASASREREMFGTDGNFQLGYQLGRLSGCLCCLLAIPLAAFGLWRVLRRKPPAQGSSAAPPSS